MAANPPKDGGPAFPTSMVSTVPGLTKREWLAGQALAGYLASYTGDDIPAAVSDVVAYADALLAELAK